MTRNTIYGASALALTVALAACGEPQFKINGEISGASDRTVILERADYNGRWMTVDSTRTSDGGEFSFRAPAPAAPEIYRLALDGRYLYIPVDSVETLRVEADAANFGTDYTLSGTGGAESLASFERELARFVPHAAVADSAAAFKRRVFSNYLRDSQGSVTAYYILTKTIGGKPLFNPSDDSDYPYFAAVATAFKEFRPSDPHTRLLEETTIRAMRERKARQGRATTVEAPEVGYFEITLPDENGTDRTLSSVIGKGRPAILAFVMLGDPDAPAWNRTLAGAADAVAIYQVGLDADTYAWRDAARNLSWTTVHDASGNTSTALRDYNVGSIPTYFIFDRSGSLTGRAATASEAVAKARRL